MPRKPSEKILSHRVLVLVKRDMTAATARVVWEHEKPILEAIFGEGQIDIVDPSALDEGYSAKPSPEMLIYNKKQDPIYPPSETASLGFVFFGDPRSEYDRLCAVYGRHPTVNETFAEHVYGRFQDGRFSLVVGAAELADLHDTQMRELLKNYGAEPEQLSKADTPEKLLELANEFAVEIA